MTKDGETPRGGGLFETGDLDLVTQAEAARLMGVTRQYVSLLVRSGKIPGYSVPGQRALRIPRIVATEWPALRDWPVQESPGEIKQRLRQQTAELTEIEHLTHRLQRAAVSAVNSRLTAARRDLQRTARWAAHAKRRLRGRT